MKQIYLDHAAATPMDPRVLAAMQPYFSDAFFNPSALYMASQKVAADVRRARGAVAQHIGCRPVELIFTAGGTEANNLAVRGVMEAFAASKVVVSALEHDSVLEPARQYDHTLVPVTEQGIIDLQKLEAAIDDDTTLVSVMYANNEIGTVQPVKDVAQVVARVRLDRRRRGIALPLYFHTDAAQATNYLDVHASRLGVDLMTLNGGKLYGPKQSGALYVKAGIRLAPILRGGGQEQGLRSGTENVAGVVGFAEALAIAQDMRVDEVYRLHGLQQYFIQKLQEALPALQVNGSLKKRLPNNVHITIPGQDNERLIMALDEAGIMAAAGSACSASKEEASHVLRAIGLDDISARSSLRFTMGRTTDQSDVDAVVAELARQISAQ